MSKKRRKLDETMKLKSFDFEWEDFLLFKWKNKSMYVLNMPQIFSNLKSSDLKMSTDEKYDGIQEPLASEKAELQLLRLGTQQNLFQRCTQLQIAETKECVLQR